MTDESTIPDWLPPPPIWPQWMPHALGSGGLVPPAPSEVPARIAFDWEEGPNGGLTGRPNPLWSRSNSRWWESIPSVPHTGGDGGILGSLGLPNGGLHQINPHWRQSMTAAAQPVDLPWPGLWHEKTGMAVREPATPKLSLDSGTVESMQDGGPTGPEMETGDYAKMAATRSSNMSHCLPLYVRCQHLHGGKLLRQGKRCEDCFNMCTLDGYWPFGYCPLPGL
jgi:hypothetical protein